MESRPPRPAGAVVRPPPLPAEARQPGLGEAVGVIALYFALQFFATGAIGLLIALVRGIGAGLQAALHQVMNQPDSRLLVLTSGLGVAACITLWLLRRRWPVRWSQAAPPGFGWCAPRRVGEYGIAMAVGVATPVAGGLLTMLLAHGHAVPQDVKQMLDGATPALRVGLVLVVVSLGPVVEELLFRGVLLSALLRHVRAGWAIAFSAAAFALIHLPDLGFLWYALPNLALLGAAAAWLRLRGGSIWPAVLAHAMNNLFAMAAWLLAGS